MSTTTTYTGVRIVDMPDLGAVTDDSSVVGEHAGSGRFAATAFRTYVAGLGTGNTGRNLLHNPLMVISQRGGGAFAASGYTLDRWTLDVNLDSSSVSQQPLADVYRTQIGDEQAAFALATTFTGNAGAAANTFVYQPVEDVRRLAGKTVTVSFWAVAGSGTPKIGVNLYQNFGTGGSPSAGVWVLSTGQAVTISSTFTRYNLTFNVPTAIGKTLGSNNNSSTYVTFWYSSGATNNAIAGNIGVQSGTFWIWGVQLEIGSVATPLEKPDPRYDLANCQRSYQTVPFYYAFYQAAGGVIYTTLALNTSMRALPTVTVGTPTLTNASAGGVGGEGLNSILVTYTVTAAGTGYYTGIANCSADL